MTIGAGLVVANNYYNQPLLGKIAKEFNISESTANNVAMLTQIGYALGLLLLIPLGDMFRRKKIIVADFVLIVLSLLTFSLSTNIYVTFAASFLIGFSSVIPQMFVPIAAQLSKPEEKGKNVGLVMSGLLVGILVSRVFSGIIGEILGWREVYYIAIVVMIIFGISIVVVLPNIKPTFKGTYSQLMQSLIYYAWTVPSLRLASLRGALGFGSFMAFWTTLTFHLERPPFFAGSDIAGMLGLVGVVGALAASFVGRMTDRMNKNLLIVVAIIAMIASWAIFGIWGFSYIGLIVGIILLDIGLQSMHITNQTIVFSSHPEATNRLNTVYMVSYFIGGSLGTFISGKAWGAFGWLGSVGVGIGFVSIALVVHFIFAKKAKED